MKLVFFAKEINNFILRVHAMDGRKKKEIRTLRQGLCRTLQFEGAGFELYSLLEPTHDISKGQVIRLAKDKLRILVRKFKKEFEEKEDDTFADLENQIIDYLFNSEHKVSLKELDRNLYIKGTYNQETLATTIARLVRSNKVNVAHTALGSMYYINYQNNWIYDGDNQSYVQCRCHYHCATCDQNLVCVYQPKHKVVREFYKLIDVGLEVVVGKPQQDNDGLVGHTIRFYSSIEINNEIRISEGLDYSVINSDDEKLVVIDNFGKPYIVLLEDLNWFRVDLGNRCKSKQEKIAVKRKFASGYESNHKTRDNIIKCISSIGDTSVSVDALMMKLGLLRQPIEKALSLLEEEGIVASITEKNTKKYHLR
jgi:predicted transcriptional regulator